MGGEAVAGVNFTCNSYKVTVAVDELSSDNESGV